MQMRYARANYPESWRWRAKLFAPGAFLGLVSCILAILIDDVSIDWRLLLFIPLFMIVSGMLSAWAGPMRMRYAIPRRRER
jgi:hypothetical protein